MPSNSVENVLFASPRNEEERGAVATVCVRRLAVKMPAVLDEFGNPVENAYTAWPDRIYLVDREGRIVYKSKPGPFGFKAEQLATAIAALTQSPPSAH